MWLIVHSLIATGLSIAVFGGANVSVIAGILAAEMTVAAVFLFAEGGVPARRIANLVTGLRLLIGILALVAVAAGVRPGTIAGVVVMWTLVFGETTDLADGFVARRLGPTPFGARLDMETDAFYMLALALVAVSWGFGRWVVVAGFLRYVVAIPFFLLPGARFGRRFSAFARIAAASAAIALLVVIYPRSPEALNHVAGWVAVGLLTLSFGWEALIRILAAVRKPPESIEAGGAMARGMLRSFLTYYGIPFRLFRMKKLYRTLAGPGDTVMDIGAHVGNRVRALRSLGARVVAVEPQRKCVELLSTLYGADPEVIVVPVACGAKEGEATLRMDPDHPTLATLSDGWIEAIDREYGELNISWNHRQTVEVRPLDDLIDEFGTPVFIKIDVEGFEAEALRGLTTPVPFISVEFLPASPDSALESLTEIERLGRYSFNYSMVETMKLVLDEWISADDLRELLNRMAPTDRSGDIYARLEASAR